MNAINDEVSLGENVMVDTLNMSAAHTAELKEAVAKSSVRDKVLFWP